jgi:hypothetical protein
VAKGALLASLGFLRVLALVIAFVLAALRIRGFQQLLQAPVDGHTNGDQLLIYFLHGGVRSRGDDGGNGRQCRGYCGN